MTRATLNVLREGKFMNSLRNAGNKIGDVVTTGDFRDEYDANANIVKVCKNNGWYCENPISDFHRRFFPSLNLRDNEYLLVKRRAFAGDLNHGLNIQDAVEDLNIFLQGKGEMATLVKSGTVPFDGTQLPCGVIRIENHSNLQESIDKIVSGILKEYVYDDDEPDYLSAFLKKKENQIPRDKNAKKAMKAAKKDVEKETDSDDEPEERKKKEED